MPLKHFMCLFEAETPLQVVALGDTMHPASGYVNEAIVGEVTEVGHLLAYPYDFAGLVFFEAVVPQARITYQGQQYRLTGTAKFLARLVQRASALNAAAEGMPFTVLTTY
ncbi:hypothetical protein GCM10027422_00100 [Hymenobacter arcticus]